MQGEHIRFLERKIERLWEQNQKLVIENEDLISRLGFERENVRSTNLDFKSIIEDLETTIIELQGQLINAKKENESFQKKIQKLERKLKEQERVSDINSSN